MISSAPMTSTSVSGRLLPPIVAAVVALTVTILVAGGTAMRLTVVDRAERRTATLGPSEAHQVALMMRLGDHSHLQELIEEVGANPDVQVARILLPDGRVLASSHAAEIGTLAAEHLRQQRPRGDYLPPSIW